MDVTVSPPRRIAVPPEAYFVASAIFHYLGPAFAVLLFARVDVLGVAALRIVTAAACFALWPDGDERDLRTRAHIQRVLGSAEVPPTDTYLGLTLDEAQAEQEGRRLVDRTPNLRSRRANLVTNRVNVLMNDDGLVVEAEVG